MNIRPKPVQPPAAIYQTNTPPSVSEIADRIDAALAMAMQPVTVYFRADDVAIPDPAMHRLLETFSVHRMPLALALVPAWLTPSRWAAFRRWDEDHPDLWCWHTHGWRHVNHEAVGRKSEFGPSRSQEEILDDLKRGMARLQDLLGGRLSPIFTPPWNRCSEDTLERLFSIGYLAVSRDIGALLPPPPPLVDIPVDVDLHTRKEGSVPDGWKTLFLQMEKAFQRGSCGFMIHHQRMNENAFRFLDDLLGVLSSQPSIRPVAMSALLPRRSSAPHQNDVRSSSARLSS
ncbi:MAG: polysaccharide deacetylase family protein [Thermodesulfobacteriota bacterium]